MYCRLQEVRDLGFFHRQAHTKKIRLSAVVGDEITHAGCCVTAWPSTRLWSLEQNGQPTTIELRTRFILPAFDITVPGPTNRFKRLRFRLNWVLNRIDFRNLSKIIIPREDSTEMAQTTTPMQK